MRSYTFGKMNEEKFPVRSLHRYSLRVKKSVTKFANFAEAEKANREFYRKLTGKERLQILVDLLAAANGDGRIDRSVFKIKKLTDSASD